MRGGLVYFFADLLVMPFISIPSLDLIPFEKRYFLLPPCTYTSLKAAEKRSSGGAASLRQHRLGLRSSEEPPCAAGSFERPLGFSKWLSRQQCMAA